VETVWGAYGGPYAAIQLKQHLPPHHYGKLSIEYERAYTFDRVELEASMSVFMASSEQEMELV
jgi:hypothetical protein